MGKLTNIILIGFPAFLVLGVGAQVIAERVAHDNAVEQAWSDCMDTEGTTEAECDAYADAGAIWQE